MEAENIAGESKEPKRLPVWACILLFIVVLFMFWIVWYAGPRMFVVGAGCGGPPSGVVGHILEASMLLAVLTAAIPMLRFERRPFSDLGLVLKGHARDCGTAS